MRYVIFTLLALLATSPVGAQITTVNPNGVGGYNVFTPGQPTTMINPNGVGGYNAFTPGYGTTFINPNGLGGYNVYSPRPVMPRFYQPNAPVRQVPQFRPYGE